MDDKEKSKLEQWSSLSSNNRRHWDMYSRTLSHSLQKSANSPFTSLFYPFFYQNRILLQKFVKNMQVLGEISDDEFRQYETFSRSYFNKNLYDYYKDPNRGFIFIVVYPLAASVFLFAHNFVIPYHPRKFKWLVPAAFLTGFTLVLNRVKLLKTSDLVNLSHWVIEKRKAEVWLQQYPMDLPGLLPFPVLSDDIVKVIVEEKLNN